jgi:hypothetical protein
MPGKAALDASPRVAAIYGGGFLALAERLGKKQDRMVKRMPPTGAQRLWNRVAAPLALGALLAVTLAGCGGGGSSTPSPPPSNNPVPALTALSPATATATGGAFTLTVTGSSFISGSVVRWDGTGRTTTFVNSTQLTAAIPASDIASPGTAQVSVFNPSPGGGTSASLPFTITTFQALAITTSMLPVSAAGKDYNFLLASTGGAPPLNWSLVSSSGNLPDGLTLDPTTGRISGTIGQSAAGTTASFTVEATDSSVPTAHTATRALSIQVEQGPLPRNDGVCSSSSTSDVATAISNGRIRASISPYGDIDVYSFQGTAGAQVTIEIFAKRLQLGTDPITKAPLVSNLDSVMELLDDNCQTIAVNDDINPGIVQDSLIQVSSSPFPGPCSGTPCGDIAPPQSLRYTGTYYIRVRDFRGDGRPDLFYELSLTGAN